MNEHSGGAPDVALIPIDGWSEESFELHPVFRWDPCSLDSLSDIVRERVKGGADPEDVLIWALTPKIRLLIANALRKAFGFVNDSDKPKLISDQIRWISGTALFEGLTIGQMASRHGISKQAFQQGAEKLRRQLLTIRSQSARPEKSRERMRLRNSRRSKNESVNPPA